MEKRVDDIEIVQQKVSDLLLTKYAIDELMAKKIAQNSIESIDKYKADLERVVLKIDSKYYNIGINNVVFHPLKLIKELIKMGIKIYSLDIAGIAVALCDIFEIFSYKIDKEEAVIMIFINMEQSQKCLYDENIYQEYIRYISKRNMAGVLSEEIFYEKLNHLIKLHIIRQDNGIYKSNDVII